MKIFQIEHEIENFSYSIHRKKKSEEDERGAVTHASLRPTSSPSWEEMVTATMDSSEARDGCKYTLRKMS
jgi:hypothetical protein